MYTEIEAKLKVDSLDEVEKRLKELGAEYIGEQLQEDILFDDAAETLTKNDSCIRLRKQVMNGQTKYILTYKGAKENSNLKKRREIETDVSNGDSVKELLSALGYKKRLIVEKNRRFWKHGKCEVALDSLNLLGNFVEIEGPDEKSINDVQKSLGLEKLQNISESYASLIADKICRDN
jgi:adenylate cyclase class 2